MFLLNLIQIVGSCMFGLILGLELSNDPAGEWVIISVICIILLNLFCVLIRVMSSWEDGSK